MSLFTRGWRGGERKSLFTRGWVVSDDLVVENKGGAKDYNFPTPQFVQAEEEFIAAFVMLTTETLVRCHH